MFLACFFFSFCVFFWGRKSPETDLLITVHAEHQISRMRLQKKEQVYHVFSVCFFFFFLFVYVFLGRKSPETDLLITVHSFN